MFDTNVLDQICKQIDDPKTFYNFAQVCKKTYMVCKLNQNDKMNQFTKLYKSSDDDSYSVSRKLPNGKLHGEQYYSDHINPNGSYSYYYNGCYIGEMYYQPYSSIVEMYVYIDCCLCSKKDYKFNKRNIYQHIDTAGFTYQRKCKLSLICKQCKQSKCVVEAWSMIIKQPSVTITI